MEIQHFITLHINLLYFSYRFNYRKTYQDVSVVFNDIEISFLERIYKNGILWLNILPFKVIFMNSVTDKNSLGLLSDVYPITIFIHLVITFFTWLSSDSIDIIFFNISLLYINSVISENRWGREGHCEFQVYYWSSNSLVLFLLLV